MKVGTKCDRCVDGDCSACTRFDGMLVVLGDEVEDCCCLHLFDHPPWADETMLDPAPPSPVGDTGSETR